MENLFEGRIMSDFEKIMKRYRNQLIHETQAKGNTKYRIEDILTDFGDEILEQLEKRIKEMINEFRFKQY